jgi:hypothetical protein
MIKLVRWLPTVLLCLLSSCASVPTQTPQSSVSVKNSGFNNVAVYAIIRGSSTRYVLGRLISGESRTFPIAHTFDSEAISIAVWSSMKEQEPFTTEELFLRPGTRITIELNDRLIFSTYMIRVP